MKKKTLSVQEAGSLGGKKRHAVHPMDPKKASEWGKKGAEKRWGVEKKH